MNNITTWTELFFESLAAFGESFMSTLPNILGALIILLLGWLFARLVAAGIRKLLKLIKFNDLTDKIKLGEMLEKGNIKLTATQLVSRFVYWLLMLLVFITASDTLGWQAVSNEISKLISYLPALFSAIIIFTLGVYFATFLRDLIRGAMQSLGISVGNIIGNFVFYLLLIVVTLTALDQAGVDTSIITSNLLMILGAILAAAAISYGFASRDILSNLLAGFFSRHTFQPGQTITIDDVTGKIIAVTSISVILQTDTDKVVIPTQELITKKIRVIS